MKKFLLLMGINLLAGTALLAQSFKPMLSIGVEPAIPVGKFNDLGYNFGIGGSLQGELKAAKELGITLNAGYMHYSAKDEGGFGLIPVLAGAKFYATPKVYIHGQLGVAIGTDDNASTEFAYSPGVGLMLTKNFDVLVKYVGYSETGTTLGSIAARVAYNF